MGDARALYKRGLEHFADGRVDEAIDVYRRAIDADSNLALAWNGLAMALSRNGDLDGAIEAGRRVIELEPDDPLSHTSLSIFYQRKGMIREAEDERALAMRIQNPDGG